MCCEECGVMWGVGGGVESVGCWGSGGEEVMWGGGWVVESVEEVGWVVMWGEWGGVRGV